MLAMDNPIKTLVTAGGRIICLRCTAMSKRTKQQCRAPAVKTSRTNKCRFHGGRSTGPKSAEGKARIAASHFKYGTETIAIRIERSKSSLVLAKLEDIMHLTNMTNACRTRGRKPNRYRPIRNTEEAWLFMLVDALHRVKASKGRVK